MSEEKKDEKKETVEAEKVDDKKEEKPNAFKKWWSSTKKSVNDSILESKIESAYKEAHHRYDVYTFGSSLFNSSSVYGDIADGSLIYWGEDKIASDSVIVDTKDNKAYYAKDSSTVTVSSTVDKDVYERKGTKIALDANVKEVKVIKANDRYFLYQGKDEKK
jgi:hypothetical protein